MILEKLKAERQELNAQYDYWNEKISIIDAVLFARQLFQGSEIDRAASAKYKIQMKLGEIDQALRDNERQIKLIALEEVELELV